MRPLQPLLAFFSLAVVCGAGGVGSPIEGPHRPRNVLPDLELEGVDESGDAATIRTRDYLEPQAPLGRLLVVRVEGGDWCGTCRWHAGHTSELFALPHGDRTRVLDLVIGNPDNDPATEADAVAWRTRVGSTTAVAADPSFSLQAMAPEGFVLPLVVLVDTRSMEVAATLANPNPTALSNAIEGAFAEMEGTTAQLEPETLTLGLFHRNEWDMIRAIRTPEPLTPANGRAVALGKALFHDEALSPSGKIACSTCHDARHALADDRPHAMGVAEGTRRTPRIGLAAFSPHQFWDGRVSSLADQALGPIEAPSEMGSSRIRVAREIATRHADAYRAVFPTHPLPDVVRLPPDGKPGNAAYDALDSGTREAVTRVLADVGEAIAAYERTFRVRGNALDAFAAGETSALTFPERQGLAMFARMGCMQCHWGARLTDDAFHATRARDADLGYHGTRRFKTPSLRGVAGGRFFGHAGAEATLTDVLDAYGNPTRPDEREPWLPRFGETTRWSILKFVSTLSGEPLVL